MRPLRSYDTRVFITEGHQPTFDTAALARGVRLTESESNALRSTIAKLCHEYWQRRIKEGRHYNFITDTKEHVTAVQWDGDLQNVRDAFPGCLVEEVSRSPSDHRFGLTFKPVGDHQIKGTVKTGEWIVKPKISSLAWYVVSPDRFAKIMKPVL